MSVAEILSRDISVIIVEISFNEYYENQNIQIDIYKLLILNDFVFNGFIEYQLKTENDVIMQTGGILISKGY